MGTILFRSFVCISFALYRIIIEEIDDRKHNMIEVIDMNQLFIFIFISENFNIRYDFEQQKIWFGNRFIRFIAVSVTKKSKKVPKKNIGQSIYCFRSHWTQASGWPKTVFCFFSTKKETRKSYLILCVFCLHACYYRHRINGWRPFA